MWHGTCVRVDVLPRISESLVSTKSVRIVTITVATLLFGVVTDEVSSHKLSSLAVSAFNGAIGTAIELVAPPSPEQLAKQRSASSSSSFEPSVGLSAPALDEARTTQAIEPDSITPVVGAVAIAEPQAPTGQGVASSLFEQAANSSVRSGGASPSSGGGGGTGSGSGSGGSSRGTSAEASETTESEPAAARLDGLMELVMSELDRDAGYDTQSVGSSSPSRFKAASSGTKATNTKPKGTAASTSSSGSNSPESSPADSTTRPAVAPSSDSVAAVLNSPTLPSEVGTEAGETGLPSDPADSLTQIVNDLLPPPSDAAPIELVALASGDPLLALVSSESVPDPTIASVETPMIVNPEPATLLLFGTGLALAARSVRRRRRAVR